MAAEIPPAPAVNAPPASALARVPGLEHGEPALAIEPLGGGTVNAVYRVDSLQGRFVVRLDGAAWRRPGVDRARELTVHRAAAAGGIAPAIVVAAPDQQGLLITEYHEGRLWQESDYDQVAMLRRLGERLYELHCLPVPAAEAFDPLQVGQDYARLIAAEHRALLASVMQRLEQACQGLRQAARAPAIVHGDLWQGNLLEGARLWLLDWEYAQLTDPLMDIACLLAYYPRAERHRDELLAAAGFDPAVQSQALMAQVDIYRILTWLWRLARGEGAGKPPASPAN
jgi:thiamine kinase